MSNQALEKFNPNALASIIGQDAMVEQVNDGFAAGISSGDFLPMLSIRGNRFRLRIDGEETVIPDTSILVYLITSRPNVSKMFYPGQYTPGGDGESSKPACSSADGQYPDSVIEHPVHDNCQMCPNNAWGSKITQSGKKGKLCSDYKFVVLSLAVRPDTAFALRIPAASLKPFSAYIQKLKLAGVPANAAITRITLGDTEFPSLEFDFADTVKSREDYDTITALAQSVEVLNAVTVQPRRAAAETPAPTPAPAVEHASTQPVVAEVAPAPAPAPVAEPAAEPAKGLADLLGTKPAAKKSRKKAEAEPETAPVAEVAPAPAEEVGTITGLDQLLAKVKKK